MTPSKHSFEPLPYHVAVRDFLKSQSPETWKWFCENQSGEEYESSAQFELLKSTYRLSQEAAPDLYAIAKQAAERLGLDILITLYQAQTPKSLNASLEYVPNHAQIVLEGSLTELLDENELTALIGHELGHLALWHGWDNEYFVAEQLLSALSLDVQADQANIETIRRYRLYTEVLCDRAASIACGAPTCVISMLLKLQTGLSSVDVESFLQQSEEVLSKGIEGSEKLTHPETYLRSKALTTWHDSPLKCETEIEAMISGPLQFDSMDVLDQVAVANQTRSLIEWILSHHWMNTELTRACAIKFFDDLEIADTGNQRNLNATISVEDANTQSYLTYVLLDFVTSDRDLEEAPLALALIAAERLGLKKSFLAIARKELRLRKSQIEKIDKAKDELIKQAQGESDHDNAL